MFPCFQHVTSKTGEGTAFPLQEYSLLGKKEGETKGKKEKERRKKGEEREQKIGPVHEGQCFPRQKLNTKYGPKASQPFSF